MKKALIFSAAAGLLFACTKTNNQTDFSTCGSPTYEGELKSLIDRKCATSGCHNGSTSPTLTNYSQVQNAALNGSLKREVIDKQSMPQGQTFSKAEYDLFNCWLNAGAPEK